MRLIILSVVASLKKNSSKASLRMVSSNRRRWTSLQ
nr:MAG TPA: hypothetical protein [Caudoviricetes sp.]